MFREKVKAWLELKARAANEFVSTQYGIVASTMLGTLLAIAWILLVVGFSPDFAFSREPGLLWFWIKPLTLTLLLLLPVCLALGLRTPSGYALAMPYLFVIGLDIFGRMLFTLHAAFAPRADIQFMRVTFLIHYIVPWITVIKLRQLGAARKAKLYRRACALQLLLLVGAVYYFTYQYDVRHLADPVVSVQRIRVWAFPLRGTLMEEEAAYVVDRNDRLFRIERDTGRKRLIARIPRPTPAKLGFPTLHMPFRSPDPYSTPFPGGMTRADDGGILFHYEHDLAGSLDNEWYTTVKVRVKITVNEETREVRWQAQAWQPHEWRDMPRHEFISATPIPPPSITVQGREIATVGYDFLGRGHNVVVRGENIETLIASLGTIQRVNAQHGWVLIAAHHRWWPRIGSLLIITAKER